jgi:CRISPR-associated endoribonuclease Cas6
MRFRLTLDLDQRNGHIIPINYQYELSSWIYHVLNGGNRDFTEWLHEKGFGKRGKSFRLFTFSRLQIPEFKLLEDRLVILEGPLSLIISFLPVSSMEYFIRGLFREQAFRLGDRNTGAILMVRSLEQLPVMNFGNEHRFRCMSPVVVSFRNRETDRYARYLGPEDVDYGKYIEGNLMEKYLAYGNGSFDGDKVQEDIIFKQLSGSKSKLVTIKQGTPAETRIRGYMYEFSVAGPPELIRMGYYAGFGEKNSLGFGCVEVMD